MTKPENEKKIIPKEAHKSQKNNKITTLSPLIQVSIALFFMTTIKTQNSDCRVGYCLKCLTGSTTSCEKCDQNFKIQTNSLGNQVCRPDFVTKDCKVVNCEACRNIQSDECMSCANGFWKSNDNKQCVSYGYLILIICFIIIIIPPIMFGLLYLVVSLLRKNDKSAEQARKELIFQSFGGPMNPPGTTAMIQSDREDVGLGDPGVRNRSGTGGVDNAGGVGAVRTSGTGGGHDSRQRRGNLA